MAERRKAAKVKPGQIWAWHKRPTVPVVVVKALDKWNPVMYECIDFRLGGQKRVYELMSELWVLVQDV